MDEAKAVAYGDANSFFSRFYAFAKLKNASSHLYHSCRAVFFFVFLCDSGQRRNECNFLVLHARTVKMQRITHVCIEPISG